MEVGIVAQRDNDRAISLATRLARRLAEASVDVALDETTAGAVAAAERWREAAAETWPAIEHGDLATRDLVVSIGGDGTFLYAARGAASTPIVGVNLGEVGFLNAVAPEDAVDAVLAAVERLRETGSPRTRSLPRLAAGGEDWSLAPAVNEVVVHGPRRGHGGGGDFAVRVDGSLYASGHADGVLVATPTGSTAYNLSEDGPLVHPDVGGLVVSEMAGEAAMPPLVVDDDSEVTVRVEGPGEAVVVGDGRIRRRVETPEQVRIARAGTPVRVAGPSRDFFGALSKLE